MNSFLHSASSAALPVAIVLLVLAASARGVLWAQIDDPRWVRIARQHLAPLSTWSVAGFITYALTLVAAGEAATGPLALALVLAVAAAVSRLEGDDEQPATAPRAGGESARGEAVVARREGAQGKAPAPAAHLFDGPGDPAAPGGLWARREDR